MVPRTIGKADIALAVVIMLGAAVIMVGQSLRRSTDGGREVVIQVSNQEFRRIPFSQVSGIVIVDVPAADGHRAVAEVAGDGRARMKESDCPDKVCVRTGWIAHPGQVIVCLPNKIVVRIEGGPQDVGPFLDGVAY